MVDLPKCACKRCGYSWTPRITNPAVCPYCKRHDWNEDYDEDRMGKTKPQEVDYNVDESEGESESGSESKTAHKQF